MPCEFLYAPPATFLAGSIPSTKGVAMATRRMLFVCDNPEIITKTQSPSSGTAQILWRDQLPFPGEGAPLLVRVYTYHLLDYDSGPPNELDATEYNWQLYGSVVGGTANLKNHYYNWDYRPTVGAQMDDMGYVDSGVCVADYQLDYTFLDGDNFSDMDSGVTLIASHALNLGADEPVIFMIAVHEFDVYPGTGATALQLWTSFPNSDTVSPGFSDTVASPSVTNPRGTWPIADMKVVDPMPHLMHWPNSNPAQFAVAIASSACEGSFYPAKVNMFGDHGEPNKGCYGVTIEMWTTVQNNFLVDLPLYSAIVNANNGKFGCAAVGMLPSPTPFDGPCKIMQSGYYGQAFGNSVDIPTAFPFTGQTTVAHQYVVAGGASLNPNLVFSSITVKAVQGGN